ncbi:hypothetical protein, partial [Mesorhizobium sp. M1A.T.Ca.IN.004.03.1.1]|uniref:hypothetical protein n=1 Tax=Mesorhizobium sp. M1A.T.Ca.IN.004.03.1.1 TaxID=2496795 RepID=UPI0013E2D9E9
SIAQQRDFVLSVAQKFIPQPPSREMLQSDPLSYMQAKADYEERMAVFNQLAYQQAPGFLLTKLVGGLCLLFRLPALLGLLLVG